MPFGQVVGAVTRRESEDEEISVCISISIASDAFFPADAAQTVCKVRKERSNVGIQPSVVKGTDIIDSGQLIVVACGVQPFDVGSNPGFVVLPNRSLRGFATRPS